jgi:sugar transferase (PEP-CTERM system associated)
MLSHLVRYNVAKALRCAKALRWVIANVFHCFLESSYLIYNWRTALVNTKVIGSYNQLLEVVEREHIDKIVVALEDRRGSLPVQALLTCKQRGIEVEESVTFCEKLCGRVMLENLRPSWLIFSPGFTVPILLRLQKRMLDLVLASLGLILALPFMLVIAILIKLDSRGPVVYRQERTGEKGKRFTLLKFRSMYVGAEMATGPVFADAEDPRVTRVGRFIRSLRLDELPQLMNVLWGDMSFVGPRPERPFFVEQYIKDIPFYDQRLNVKPGITGWAQVRYPYGATLKDAAEKLRFDLFYVKNMSLLFDLFIILKTVKIVLLGYGAR